MFFCLLIFAFCATPLQAENDQHTFAEALVITGDEMQYEPQKNESYVVGHAKAQRSPTEKNSWSQHILTADTFCVQFRSQGLSSEKNIQSIQAQGHVCFRDKDFEIKAEQCIYYPPDVPKSDTAERIVCKTKVTLKKGKHVLKGDQGEVNLKTGLYQVTTTSPTHPVEAVIMPQPSKTS